MTDDAANHARNQAIAVLAIATAILGFGLFSVEFRGLTAFVEEKGVWIGVIHAALAYLFAVMAFVLYLKLIVRVSAILRKPDASSDDVTRGVLAGIIPITSLVGIVFLMNRL